MRDHIRKDDAPCLDLAEAEGCKEISTTRDSRNGGARSHLCSSMVEIHGRGVVFGEVGPQCDSLLPRNTSLWSWYDRQM
jgi:hypothetical protein